MQAADEEEVHFEDEEEMEVHVDEDEEYEYILEDDDQHTQGEGAGEMEDVSFADDYQYVDDDTKWTQPVLDGRLVHDVQQLNDADKVQCRLESAGSTCAVCIALDVSRFVMDSERSLAWGINPTAPLTLILHFDHFYITSTRGPTVVCAGQPSGRFSLFGDPAHSFSLSWMIKNRLERFMKEDWPPLLEMFNDTAEDLVSMFGISKQLAIYVLGKARGDRAQATDLLLDETARVALTHELLSSQTAEADDPPQEAPTLTRQDSYSLRMVELADHRRRSETPLARSNYLFRIVHFLEDTLRTCTQKCLVCDDSVPISGFRPVVCSKAVCNMAYEELGVGLDVGAELQRDPFVADLLITALYAAAHGGRVQLVYPENIQVHVPGNCTMSFMKGDAQDTAILIHVLSQMPLVSLMCQWAKSRTLNEQLTERHPLLYPLLRWMFSSNRAHLRSLEESEKIPGLCAAHQFVMLTGPVEKEATFQKLKMLQATPVDAAAHPYSGRGSFYAFHGSSMGNWHSILRMGLKNYSNSKYMSAGASYGAGVYFADLMSISLHYSKPGHLWPNSELRTLTCMALCEIVDKRESFTHSGNNLHVVPDEDLIACRFLLINPQGEANATCLTVPNLGL